jgi:hypothetical protein
MLHNYNSAEKVDADFLTGIIVTIKMCQFTVKLALPEYI